MPALDRIRTRIAACAPVPDTIRLLAVSKRQPNDAIRALAAQGQRAFGENYVQEGVRRVTELAGLELEWHLIGPLQSNKCREAATAFDWIQTIDREKLLEPLAQFRPPERRALNVLVQVNIDDQASKSGARPEAVPELCARIAAQPRLLLRGLMAIPAPHPDVALRRLAFARMRQLFAELRPVHDGFDTLSMGMSDDFELAIAEGATMVRVGTALFGPRPPRA